MSGQDLWQKSSRRLWIVAALGAIALHLGCVALAIANRDPAEADDDLGAPGLEIGFDLAAPVAPPTDLPPGPDSDASAASPAQVEQKAVEKQSDLPKDTPIESDDPDRVVAPDATKKPQEETPDTPTAQATPSNESVAAEATATPTSDTAKPSERSTTIVEGSGEARQKVRVTWQKLLNAQLYRHLRYPANRLDRPPRVEIVVSFELDRTGHILSSSVVRGSGDSAFDEAALEMLKRSDPLPPPPPLIADDGLVFTMPVIFRPPKGRG
jgi:periplasmic protein TonB